MLSAYSCQRSSSSIQLSGDLDFYLHTFEMLRGKSVELNFTEIFNETHILPSYILEKHLSKNRIHA